VTAPAAPGPVGGAATGSIYDLGYRGYDGPRSGRPVVVRALLRQSLQEAYGIGRGGRAKVAPFLLLIFNAVPAMLAVGISAFLNQAGGSDVLEQGMQHEEAGSDDVPVQLLRQHAEVEEVRERLVKNQSEVRVASG